MARIRSVHPDICISETMDNLSAELERTFVRLWTHCDDEGRCEDRPKIIKAAIYPLSDSLTALVLDQQLSDLQDAGLIQRYEVDGKGYIQVTSWSEYQKPQKPKPSLLPPPPEGDTRHEEDETSTEDVQTATAEGETPTVAVSPNGHTPTVAVSDVYAVGEGEGVGVGVGEGEGGNGRTRTRRRQNIAAAKWKPTTELIEWAVEAFPNLDVVLETEKFIDHFTATGKPMKDWDAAWKNWMRRSLDFAGSRR